MAQDNHGADGLGMGMGMGMGRYLLPELLRHQQAARWGGLDRRAAGYSY